VNRQLPNITPVQLPAARYEPTPPAFVPPPPTPPPVPPRGPPLQFQFGEPNVVRILDPLQEIDDGEIPDRPNHTFTQSERDQLRRAFDNKIIEWGGVPPRRDIITGVPISPAWIPRNIQNHEILQWRRHGEAVEERIINERALGRYQIPPPIRQRQDPPSGPLPEVIRPGEAVL